MQVPMSSYFFIVEKMQIVSFIITSGSVMQANLARLVGLQSVTVRKTTGNDEEVATIIFYKMKLS